MKKRILVTGATGFIGFHLCLFLKKRGDRVIGMDNFNDYYDPALKRARAKILNDEGIHVVEEDIIHFSVLLELLKLQEITHLVHLAAQAGVRYSLTDPQAYIKSNVEGFVNVLEAIRHLPSIKLTYASSSSVYGLNKNTPFSETDRTDHQASLYGVTKKTNELLAQTYHHLYQISVTGLRFFTVYGPWGRPDMAYYSFAKAIVNNETIDVYNAGNLARDFTYIDDVVDGIAAALDLEAPCEIFNLGNHQPVKLLDFINTLEHLFGREVHKNFVGMQPGDVVETYADIEHSQSKLGYHPKTSIEEGLTRFVAWYREYHQ